MAHLNAACLLQAHHAACNRHLMQGVASSTDVRFMVLRILPRLGADALAAREAKRITNLATAAAKVALCTKPLPDLDSLVSQLALSKQLPKEISPKRLTALWHAPEEGHFCCFASAMLVALYEYRQSQENAGAGGKECWMAKEDLINSARATLEPDMRKDTETAEQVEVSPVPPFAWQQHIHLVKEKLIKPHAHRGTTLFELLPAGKLEAKRLMSQGQNAGVGSSRSVPQPGAAGPASPLQGARPGRSAVPAAAAAAAELAAAAAEGRPALVQAAALPRLASQGPGGELLGERGPQASSSARSQGSRQTTAAPARGQGARAADHAPVNSQGAGQDSVLGKRKGAEGSSRPALLTGMRPHKAQTAADTMRLLTSAQDSRAAPPAARGSQEPSGHVDGADADIVLPDSEQEGESTASAPKRQRRGSGGEQAPAAAEGCPKRAKQEPGLPGRATPGAAGPLQPHRPRTGAAMAEFEAQRRPSAAAPASAAAAGGAGRLAPADRLLSPVGPQQRSNGAKAEADVAWLHRREQTAQAPSEHQPSSSPPAEDVILILDSSDEDEVPAGPSLPAGRAAPGLSQGAAAGGASGPPQRPGQAAGSQPGQRSGHRSPAGRPALAAPATPQALQRPAAPQRTPTTGAWQSPAATGAGRSGPAPSAGLPAAVAKLSDSGNEGAASSTGTSQSKPGLVGRRTSQGHPVQPASPRAPVPDKSQPQAAALPERSTCSGSPSAGSPGAASPRPPAGSFSWSSPARLPHNHPAPVAAVLATLAAPHSSAPRSSSSSRPADPAAAAGPASAQPAGAPAAPGRPSSVARRPGAGLAGTPLAGSSLMARRGAQSAAPGMTPTKQLHGGPSGGTQPQPPRPLRVVDIQLGHPSASAGVAAVSRPFSNSPEPGFHMTQPWNHSVSMPPPGSVGQAGPQPAPQASLPRPASISPPGQPQQNGIPGMAPPRQQGTSQQPLPAGAVRPGEATPWQRRMDAGWEHAIAAIDRDCTQGPMDGVVRK